MNPLANINGITEEELEDGFINIDLRIHSAG